MSAVPLPSPPERAPLFADLDRAIASGRGDVVRAPLPPATQLLRRGKHREGFEPWEIRRARYLKERGRLEELQAEGLENAWLK